MDTFVSHSSLGVDERRAAEQAFAQRQNCVIVATSSLELGLDVGDLDRVIQIDALLLCRHFSSGWAARDDDRAPERTVYFSPQATKGFSGLPP